MTLPEPLVKSITAAEALYNRDENFRPALLQVFTGPNRTGKTVKAGAYATALFGAGLTDNDGLDIVCCANFTTTTDLQRIIDSAAGKVLAIDEFEKLPPDPAMGDMLAKAAIGGDCVIVFTGKAEGMKGLADNHAKLYALLPKPIEFTTVYDRDPEMNNALQAQRDKSKHQAENNRAAVLERRRLSQVWKALQTVDVSLPVAIKPVKTVRFAPKVKT